MIYLYSAIILFGGVYGAYALGQHILRAQRTKEREEMREALKRNIEQDNATPPVQ